jgi:hypothetical protein
MSASLSQKGWEYLADHLGELGGIILAEVLYEWG